MSRLNYLKPGVESRPAIQSFFTENFQERLPHRVEFATSQMMRYVHETNMVPYLWGLDEHPVVQWVLERVNGEVGLGVDRRATPEATYLCFGDATTADTVRDRWSFLVEDCGFMDWPDRDPEYPEAVQRWREIVARETGGAWYRSYLTEAA